MRSTFKTALLACAALAIAPAAQAQLLSPQWPSEQRARFLALGKAQWSLDQTCNTMIAFTRTLEADAFFANFNGVPARVAMANDFAAWRQDDARGLGAKHPSSVFNWSICEGNPAATAMFALLPVAISAPAPLPAPAPAAARPRSRHPSSKGSPIGKPGKSGSLSKSAMPISALPGGQASAACRTLATAKASSRRRKSAHATPRRRCSIRSTPSGKPTATISRVGIAMSRRQ
jgi:hypothetical protein